MGPKNMRPLVLRGAGAPGHVEGAPGRCASPGLGSHDWGLY